MQTTAAKLQFAVRFANLDLDRLRPGDWLNLRDDFLDFLSRRGLDASHINTYPPGPREYSEEAYRTLQRDVHALLMMLAGQSAGLEAPIVVQFELNVFSILENNQDQKGLLVPAGPLRDLVLWTLSHLIGDAPTDVIRACPECGTLFYRVRKQQYCSTRCVKRVSMRQWRQTEAGKEYERKRSHDRYVAQTKARTSPNAKVGSRPRSRKQNTEE